VGHRPLVPSARVAGPAPPRPRLRARASAPAPAPTHAGGAGRQTGWLFSGPFHDGARPPPRRWLGRALRPPAWLSALLGPGPFRAAPPLRSDMYALVAAQRADPGAARAELLIGFLAQRDHLGSVPPSPSLLFSLPYPLL